MKCIGIMLKYYKNKVVGQENTMKKYAFIGACHYRKRELIEDNEERG